MCDNYVTYHNGNQMLFTLNGLINLPFDNSYSFGCHFNGEKIDSYALNTVIGILHLSSNKIYTTNKRDIIRKEFSPFFKCIPKILVKTKKLTTFPDVCAIVEIEDIDNNGEILYGSVVEYLGEPDKIKQDVLLKALSTCHWSRKLDRSFEELSIVNLNDDVLSLDNLCTYSIDPPGCEDIDDAISCIITDNGYEVGIHIADVSSFIEANSKYDIELSKRVESIYFQESELKQINMIPSSLSINHMSLKEGIKKRTFSVFVNFDKNMNIINIMFKKTLITVTKNLTYDECQNMITTDNTIKLLYNLGNELKNKFIDSFLEQGEYDTHQMVAIFMILANKCVAEYIAEHDSKNVLLRVKYSSKYKNKLILMKSNDIPINLLNKYNISLSEKAYYKIGIDNAEHVGMGLKYYTHFTSPIRRYADIIVHRHLYSLIKRNSNFKVTNVKTLFLMNTYSKFYKQIERYSHQLSIISKLEKNIFETQAFIISIRNNNPSIRLYIPELDMEYDMIVVNKKIRHLITIIFDENMLCIKNNQFQDEIILKLFQNIKIKIVITNKTLDRINVNIIEPNIMNFISL